MDVVPRNANNPLYKKDVFAIWLFGWLVEDNNVVAPDFAVVHKGCPLRGRSERRSLDHYMVARQQGTRPSKRKV